MLAVIGAGFAGTGTGPLAAALERLGFGPCHDLQALVRQPGLIPAWEEAVDGAIPDWDRLLAGYASTVGWPGCHFWREFADRYPAARLILTLREPHAWYRRASATLFRERAERPPAEPAARAVRQLARRMILQQTFGGSAGDEALAIEALRLHEAEVRRAIAPERLLAFDVAEGWAPLCRFLGAEIPKTPFPGTA
ncbi:MAG: sulfotransferase [Geminicoccaceae bacterium]